MITPKTEAPAKPTTNIKSADRSLFFIEDKSFTLHINTRKPKRKA